jgi:molecular chaperone DnaK (HSP70)
MNQYVVGIDLGTTNTVVAYAKAGVEAGNEDIQLFDIEQLVAPGEIAVRALLPSLRYHAAAGELAAGALQLPWPQPAAIDGAEAGPVVIGSLARKLGAQVPGRLVASAKSWLSHAAVDRLAPILPWGAAAEVGKVSPVAASTSYLAYVRAAWNWRFPHSPLEQQELVLTVPASFDEGARALTMAAARQAGLPNLRLLEEPQAAFYDWLFRHRQTLAAELAQTRLVLVCDVGGGTTDFSLIKVDMRDGEPELTRIGVGNHLMLGGDNMDLALAHLVETRLADSKPDSKPASKPASEAGASAPRLSASSLSQLIERCRAAKELLLAKQAPERTLVTLLGTGSRLIGAARSVALTREEVERLVVDGFFPMVGPDELPRRARSGLVEFGLPYASDAAVTRHLAGFLRQHAAAARQALGSNVPGEAAFPDTVLLNGGVFRADALASRLIDTLGAWRGAPPRLLHNDNPDVAVARGAVAYALARQGRAPKIGGGSPRSYFLVLDEDKKKGGPDTTPDRDTRSRRGICILPRGSETDHEILLKDRSFALRLGQPVRFHLVSSTAESGNQPPPRAGEIVDLESGDFVRLPPIAMVMQAEAAHGRREIPVQLATALTEVGTLDLHCVEINEDGRDAGQRWLLAFQLRGEDAQSGDVAESENEDRLPPRFAEAIEKIDRIFGARAQQVASKEVKQLRLQLEHLLGKREHWRTPLLRQLFDALWQRQRGRRRSAEHERLWLNLAGYCLRPGYGYPLDDWRIEQLWSLFELGAQHGKDSHVGSEWWTLWRRVAGGLDTKAQARVLDDFAFNLQGEEPGSQSRPPALVKGSYDDMLRVGASLERIPADYKIEIGTWLLDRIQASTAAQHKPDGMTSRNLWAIGRIGARQPFYGSAHDVVPPEIVANWLAPILALDWKRIDAAAFAAAHLARMTGDRSRDLAHELREQIIRRLGAINAAPTWIAMVQEIVQLDEANTQRVLGESLPPGLKLIR